MFFRKSGVATAMVALLSLTAATAAFAQGTDTDGDGIPDVAEPLLGTDPQQADTDGDGQNDLVDSAPTFAENPITPGGATPSFQIAEALVENNFDPATGRDAPDHLELLVVNHGAATLEGLTVYYTITDHDDGRVEAYARTLDSFSVPPNREERLHFDDATIAGHFRANPNGIYSTSEAAKMFSVTVAAAGMAPVNVEIAKDAGGAEEAD